MPRDGQLFNDNAGMDSTDTRSKPAETGVVVPSGLQAPEPVRMRAFRVQKMPAWLTSFLASNMREKVRLRAELSKIKGAIPLLMKPRNGDKWTDHERSELNHMLRSASAISPYLFIWVLPGSILFLPFLAWSLDVRRHNRESRLQPPP
jgi:hypothetical protein